MKIPSRNYVAWWYRSNGNFDSCHYYCIVSSMYGGITRKQPFPKSSIGFHARLISRFWLVFMPRGQTCLEFYAIMYVCYGTSYVTTLQLIFVKQHHRKKPTSLTDSPMWKKDIVEKRFARFDMQPFYNILKKYLSGNIKKEEFWLTVIQK